MSFETSIETDKIASALAKAQGEFKDAIPNRKAHYGYYADLSACMNAVRDALSKHEIALVQAPLESPTGRMSVVTWIGHGGQWIKSTYSMPIEGAGAQKGGSAITYAKRYALTAILAIVGGEEDDDGSMASGNPKSTETSKSHRIASIQDPIKKEKGPTPSEMRQQVTKLSIAAGFDKAAMAQISKERYKIESSLELDPAQLSDLILFLKTKIPQAKS